MGQLSFDDYDRRISSALVSWAEMGTLSPDRSSYLECMVIDLAGMEKRRRIRFAARGFIAAATILGILFIASPPAGGEPICGSLMPYQSGTYVSYSDTGW